MARRPKLVGIQQTPTGWRAYVRVQGRLRSKRFPPDTPTAEIRQWREDAIVGEPPAPGHARPASFGADINAYLARIRAMPTYRQRAAHLRAWAQALGRDRARHSITPKEIDAVMQHWLLTPTRPDYAAGERGRPSAAAGLNPQTVRKRRTSLQSFFAMMNAQGAKNPVRGTMNPKAPKAEARGLDYPTIERILAAMPDTRSVAKGRPAPPSLAKARARVIAYTGLPPSLLMTVRPADLDLEARTVRVAGRHKGEGAAARTLPLTPAGLDAFRAFDAVQAYGRFASQKVNIGFQRAAARVGCDPATVHLYDLRHSFGMEMYRVTRDLATVARFLGHAEGSAVTARYAQGANAAVDVAAAAAFGASLAAQGIHPQPPPPASARPVAAARRRPRSQIRLIQGVLTSIARP